MSGYAPYDYAWDTPGWNAQSPTVPATTDGYVDPGMPADVNTVRIFGKFMEHSTGRALEGTFRVRIKEDLLHVPTGSLIPAGDLRRLRFRRGEFNYILPATDDPQLVAASGGNWVYYARLTVRGTTKEFAFSLPSLPDEVNVFDLLPPLVGDKTDGGVVYDGGAV